MRLSRTNTLFASGELAEAIIQRGDELRRQVARMPKPELLETPTKDLCDLLRAELEIQVPVLLEADTYVEPGEAHVDVIGSLVPGSHYGGTHRPLSAHLVEVAIPFEGDGQLFKLRPSTFGTTRPQGEVREQELRMSFDTEHHGSQAVKSMIDAWVADIKKHLGWLQRQAVEFNDGLHFIARQAIEDRKRKVMREEELVASLGFPLKKRDDAPKTYALPVKRRTPAIGRSPATVQPFTPEPELAQAEYEEILRIVQNMVEVMERSPHAFQTMGEEDLRQHFLVQLNGQYEGQATGETFNMGGKTDILIRADGRNVFIAECKFWKGAKGFRETIDQLLGYTSWRDTKTAILLFNRGRQLSTVLEKVPEVVAEYPNYKRTLDYASETGFRFVLHQNGDENRDVTLTVLVFDVPGT